MTQLDPVPSRHDPVLRGVWTDSPSGPIGRAIPAPAPPSEDGAHEERPLTASAALPPHRLPGSGPHTVNEGVATATTRPPAGAEALGSGGVGDGAVTADTRPRGLSKGAVDRVGAAMIPRVVSALRRPPSEVPDLARLLFHLLIFLSLLIVALCSALVAPETRVATDLPRDALLVALPLTGRREGTAPLLRARIVAPHSLGADPSPCGSRPTLLGDAPPEATLVAVPLVAGGGSAAAGCRPCPPPSPTKDKVAVLARLPLREGVL